MGSPASSCRRARPASRSPGWGISVDAVVSDFIAGAAEQLVVEGIERGGELLFVEGQGSLLHPAYSGVTLGLIHGSAPHAYVLCHQAGQTVVDDDDRFPMPQLAELVDLHERMSLLARPAASARDRTEHAAARRGRGAARDRGGRGRQRPAGRRPGPVRGGEAGRCADVRASCSRRAAAERSANTASTVPVGPR